MPKNIQSIERAAAILRLLSGRTRRLGVVDLAGELGLPKGTVHGLLRTLQHVGFVEQDEETGKYQLGAALLHMGSSYLDGNELRTRALNWSDSLAARTQRERAHRDAARGPGADRPPRLPPRRQPADARRRRAAARSRQRAGQDPARRPPLRGGASWRDPGLESFTPATITDPEALERELERVRKRGWAADIGELVNGEVSCAAPILDRRGVTVGAMGVSGPPERLLAARQPRGDLVAFVREAARAVSRELGAIPW